MKRNCPYCGEKIQVGVEQCEHCGKMFRKQKTNADDESGLTNLDSWKQKSIPSWVMYLTLVVAIFCIGMVIAKGCEKSSRETQTDKNAFNFSNPVGSNSCRLAA